MQAAVSLLEAGYSVLMCEEVSWVGGQLSAQAVPPDEHPWVEYFGCTRRYREYRNAVRGYYRQHPDFDGAGSGGSCFDPGASWVSRIAHPPALAHQLLMRSLGPFLDNGRLILLRNTVAVSARGRRSGGAGARLLQSVRLRSLREDRECEVRAAFFIDGSDLGDLLPLAGAEYLTGTESRRDTGEPGAALRADPGDMQPATWVLSLGLNCGESPIAKPPSYETFRALIHPHGDHAVLSRFGPGGGATREFPIMENEGDLPLWSYRRIQFPGYWKNPADHPEISLLNWPQNDYFMANIIGHKGSSLARALPARELSLSFLYWLQTAAARPGGGRGYPEIGLLRNVLGSDDGAAQFPYIREGRRIRALRTVTARDITADFHPDGLPRQPDSVGIGYYPMDIHITTGSHHFGYGKQVLPFEIPLSALIPRDFLNLIPASKNIGTTHLSNACFRTHPVEWNIGEVAGHIASFCLRHGLTLADLYHQRLPAFQDYIQEQGVEIRWPDGDWYRDEI